MAKLSKQAILKALVDVNGIGPKTAGKVWDKFKSKTPEMLLNSPDLVAKAVRGVSLKRANAARKNIVVLSQEEGEATPPSSREFSARSMTPPSARAANGPQTELPNSDRFLSPGQVKKVQGQRWSDIHEARRRAEQVFERYKVEILEQPNVHGAHVGFRRRDDSDGESKVTSDLEVCIRVHVGHKLPPESPLFNDERLVSKLKRELEGIPVDVCELRFDTLDLPGLVDPRLEATPRFARAASPTPVEDPLIGGIEIATEASPTNRGTMGGIVFHGVRAMMITNAHVARKDAAVIQPGGGATVGEVEMSEISSASRPSSLDCSLIRSNLSRTMRQRVKHLDGPQRFSKSLLDDTDVHRTEAIMVGAISKKQVGTVKSVRAAVKIGNAIMSNQILVESKNGAPIIQAGDSGSWLLTRQIDQDGAHYGYNVVGLVHARNKEGTQMVATHFQDIATRFGVSISPQF